jgi:hypothetical protein
MRIGRKIIIAVILALGAVGSILAASQGPVTIADGPVHIEITLSSASPSPCYYLAKRRLSLSRTGSWGPGANLHLS